jgi:hypothetical protein
MNIYREGSIDLRNTYRMIFSLPSLKYNELSLFLFDNDGDDDDDVNIFLPLVANEQFSTIEYLVINHKCTIDELLSMLSHTPRLRHLACDNLVEFEYPIRTEHSIVLSNLTYLRFDAFFGDFDDFEMSMAKLLAPVQVLVINNLFDDTYLDADRWERFIVKHMPHLSRLRFTLFGCFPIDYEDTTFNDLINRFTSSFWIERQWLFEVKIEYSNIYYSIRPYRYSPNVCLINKLTFLFRNIWLDTYKNAEITTFCNRNISDNSIQPIQLSIEQDCSSIPHQSFLDKFESSFKGIQFTRLIISCEKIPIGLLVNIIYLLPSLISLKVSSLPLIQPGCLFDDNGKICFLTSINNKITKVNLEKIMNIEQVLFILHLCLHIQYFQVDIPKDMDLSMFLRFILIKASTYIPHRARNEARFYESTSLRLVTLCLASLRLEFVLKSLPRLASPRVNS